MKATFKLLSQEGKAVNFLQPQKQKVDVRFDPTFFQACSWLDSRRLQLCGALEALCKHCHISFMGSTLCSSPTLLLSAAAAAASLQLRILLSLAAPMPQSSISQFALCQHKIFLDKKKMH